MLAAWHCFVYRLIGVGLALSLAACALVPAGNSSSETAGTGAPVAEPVAPQPLAQALNQAVTRLLSTVPKVVPGSQAVLVDPFMDGASGMETAASRSMVLRVADLIRKRRPDLPLSAMNTETFQRLAWVLIGTLTPVSTQGSGLGLKDAYRLCLGLVDLRSAKLLGRGLAFVRAQNIDATPLPFYQDSPAWLREPLTESLIQSCEGTAVGGVVASVYLQGVEGSMLVAQGITTYQAGRYDEAVDYFRSALKMPPGEQLRALNGLYLAALRRKDLYGADQAFGRLVDFGLARRRIAFQFGFNPGRINWSTDASVSSLYSLWLDRLAQNLARSGACIDVVGNASRGEGNAVVVVAKTRSSAAATSQSAALAEVRLSELRALAIRTRLIAQQPALKNRLSARGVGARQVILGLGTNDPRDALDRRTVLIAELCH
jgi:tetratricopeptide (TPR) repeat protein